MSKHRHEPTVNGWYHTSPTSSWNAECRACGQRIFLVHRGTEPYWRTVRGR